MILTFADHDGDPVAVESAQIVGLSVGSLNGPRKPDATITVTLIWAAGAPQPFMVAASFADVLHRWTEARGESLAMRTAHPTAHPGVYPLVAHQYPGGAR